MRKINIQTFKQLGIQEKQALDCFDMPIAYATTVYSPEYYYCYFLLALLKSCWTGLSESWLKDKNEILQKIGLEFCCNKVRNREEFFDAIYKNVDNNIPTFVLLDYYNIFYEPTFYKHMHISHGALITGYEKAKQRIVLQENAHMDFVGMYQLYLTNSMIYKMWNETTKFEEEQCIYAIKQLDTAEYIGLIDILEYFSDQISNVESQLIKIVDANDFSYYNNAQTQTILRKKEYISMELLFDIIEGLMSEPEVNFTNNINYVALKKDYLDTKNKLVLKMIKCGYTGKCLSDCEKNSYISKLRENDKKLSCFIQKFVQSVRENNKLVDCALNCKVIASSEAKYNESQTYAKNIVNGDIYSLTSDNIWISNDTDEEHFVLLDMETNIRIEKIVLRFTRNYSLNYSIYASQDNEMWNIILNEQNNDKETAIYDGLNTECRFIKIKFEIPSIYGSTAELIEVEAWGKA